MQMTKALKPIIAGLILVTSLGCEMNFYQDPFSENVQKNAILAPGIISTAENHESLSAISDDGLTVYFTRSDRSFQSSTLYSSRFTNPGWSPPEVLPFSGQYYDAGLAFSPKRDFAFFTSKRNPENPDLSKEWNIWQISKAGDAWGEPKVLPSPINSKGQDCCLTMNINGDTYFSSDRAGTWDIYYSKYESGKFSEPKKLGVPVNSANGEWPGFVNPSNDMLLFSSIRPNGIGGDDIYIARREGLSWRLQLLDSTINSNSYEDSPLITQDSRYLIYASWKNSDFSKGVSNIYVSPKPNWLSRSQKP